MGTHESDCPLSVPELNVWITMQLRRMLIAVPPQGTLFGLG